MDKSKYKRLASLYATGTELELEDDTVLWMQVLNSFEYDECKNVAQVARARMTLALREMGSDELTKLDAQIAEDGREMTIQVLADSHQQEWLLQATHEIVDDPEWSERVEVMERFDDAKAAPATEEERELLAKINTEYWTELQARIETERKATVRRLETLSDEDLREEYKELWIDRRGADAAMGEYRLHEAFYAARACEGKKKDDGTWDHSECGGHRERAFDAVEELREMPDELQEILAGTMQELNMTVREAKDSGREMSSSDSSPAPNAPEDSEPSAPEEASSTPPGT